MTESTPPSPPATKGLPLALALIWAGGLAARLAFVALEPTTRPIADETMWLMALRRIPAAGFSPFANYPIFHPPLYPYFLAAVYSVFGSLGAIKVAQAVLGSLLIPAVYRIGERIFGARAGIFAAGFAAFYPELVWYAAHFWCETLFLVLFWWAVERTLAAGASSSWRVAAASGALFGLAVLTRETLLYVMPVAAVWLVFSGPIRRPRLGLALIATTLAVVAPWTVRNRIQFGAFIPVSTGGGLNLYQGNAEVSRGEVYEEYYANEGKVEQYQWARAAGLRAIWKRQPMWIFEKIRDEGPRLAEIDSLALIHIRRGAYGAVSCRAYEGAAAILLLPWLLVGAATVLALSRLRLTRETALLLGILLAYLSLHIATHGFARYRLPVAPAFFLLASSLATADCRIGRPWTRRLLLVALAAALALLWAPSALDQLGHLGWVAPPTFEGFAPVCPVS